MSSIPSTHSITFIIPVLNGEKHITSCLEHIEREMASDDEVIVVDNGSRDATIELSRKHKTVRILVHPDLNIGALRNRGAAVARGDILAFVDSDCLVQPGWKEAVVRTLEDSGVAATGSYCDIPSSATWVERAWWSNRKARPTSVEWINSANFVVRRSVFDRIGGFDETLVTDEDWEIGSRLIRRGETIIDAPDIRSVHMGNPKTLMEFIQKEKWHASSIMDTVLWHKPDKPMLMTFVFMLSVVFMLVGAVGCFGYGQNTCWAGLTVLVAPILSGLYRVITTGRYGLFFSLVVLYFFFYLVRIVTIVEYLFGRWFR